MSLLGIAGKNIIFAIPNKEIQRIFFNCLSIVTKTEILFSDSAIIFSRYIIYFVNIVLFFVLHLQIDIFIVFHPRCLH